MLSILEEGERESPPVTWTDSLSTATAVVALVFSIAAYIRSGEPRVRWRVERGENTEYRIMNDSTRWIAHILSVSDSDPIPKPYSSVDLTHTEYPVIVDPSNWLPIHAMQIDGRPAIRATIRWQQQHISSLSPRRKVHETRLYL